MTKSKDSTYDVFFSFASEDREPIAESIIRTTRLAGLSIWYDNINSPVQGAKEQPKRAVAIALHEAITRCTEVWLLIGPTYSKREWTRYEAFTLAALLACGMARFSVIYHGMSDAEARHVLASFGIPSHDQSLRIVEFVGDSEAIVARLASSFVPRISLVMMRFIGPLDIVVVTRLGQIWIFPNGGIQAYGKEADDAPAVYDLAGKSIEDQTTNMDGLIKALLGRTLERGDRVTLDELMSTNIPTADDNKIVTLGLFNHPLQSLCTEDEIRQGATLELGSLTFIPTLTYGPMTIGLITDGSPTRGPRRKGRAGRNASSAGP